MTDPSSDSRVSGHTRHLKLDLIEGQAALYYNHIQLNLPHFRFTTVYRLISSCKLELTQDTLQMYKRMTNILVYDLLIDLNVHYWFKTSSCLPRLLPTGTIAVRKTILNPTGSKQITTMISLSYVLHCYCQLTMYITVSQHWLICQNC